MSDESTVQVPLTVEEPAAVADFREAQKARRRAHQ